MENKVLQVHVYVRYEFSNQKYNYRYVAKSYSEAKNLVEKHSYVYGYSIKYYDKFLKTWNNLEYKNFDLIRKYC